MSGIVLATSCVHTQVKLIQVIAALFYLAGFILVVLSIAMFREEKEALSSQVAVIIRNTATRNAQPATDQPTIIASLASVCILIGTVFVIMGNPLSEKLINWLGIALVSLGWAGNAFAASMSNNAASSVQNERLAFTLPAAFLVVLGSVAYLYECSTGLVFAGLGALLFAFGDASVL
jgi:hypothetical protein